MVFSMRQIYNLFYLTDDNILTNMNLVMRFYSADFEVLVRSFMST